ncbi:thymidine phosphorylase [Elongatibacter sediminis]|uniref:Thymidine phosphorylase n=1 Tax=Elongatibacter sediminis TaxID=3119006 RepID=A0AAW9RIN8_9GAMM
MQLTTELIRKTRDGESVNAEELTAFVQGITNATVTDAQIAAFAMAVWFRGMTVPEQSALTLAMRDSGRVLEWSGLNGPVVDKHSTGGVGDFVSLVLGPLVASAGGYVPMISGRGLGHTGGTLDKLESIPGFVTRMAPDRFQSLVRRTGVAIIGQTEDLAPADRRIYAVRDVTATVASMPLIVSSILSKKLAEGLDGLVMDVKLGNGAFMRDVSEARALAEDLCRVAQESGVRCNAVLTEMGQPIARTAGNALEVAEAADFLAGRQQHPRMREIVIELAAELLVLGGLESDLGRASGRAGRRLDDGSAAERFEAMVARQGGPPDFVEQARNHLPKAPVTGPVTAGRTACLAEWDMRALGLAVIALGGGRRRAEDEIDPSVGLAGLISPGVDLSPDSPLCHVHAASEDAFEQAVLQVREAVRWSEAALPQTKTSAIRARIAGADVKAE